MTDLRKAAEDLLEAVEAAIKAGDWKVDGACDPDSATQALRQALAQEVTGEVTGDVDETAKGEQEPVGFFSINDYGNWEENENGYGTPLYTAPPKREWVGLTDEEVIKCFDSVAFGQVEDDLIINKHVNIFRAIHGIETKLKEKNT